MSLIAALLASPFFIVLQLREEDRYGTETDLDNGAHFAHNIGVPTFALKVVTACFHA